MSNWRYSYFCAYSNIQILGLIYAGYEIVGLFIRDKLQGHIFHFKQKCSKKLYALQISSSAAYSPYEIQYI